MGLMNRQTINIFRAISILYQAHYPVSIYLTITNNLISVLDSPIEQLRLPLCGVGCKRSSSGP